MNRVGALLGLVLAVISPVWAQTAYVTENVYVDIRADPHIESVVIHRVLAGEALEVLEQAGDFSRVRDAQGREGWIEGRDLMQESPARIREASLKRELAELKAELANARAQLEITQGALAEDNADAKQLASAHGQLKRRLTGMRSKLAKTEEALTASQARLKELEASLAQESAKSMELTNRLAATELAVAQVQALQEPLEPGTGGSGDEPQIGLASPVGATERFYNFLKSLHFLWLGISFAMLIIGFAAGILWLREVNRKKLGGMYLRI
ncbi:MAG: TIGR04211 family SH3 domain-containing protein [Gammaproteobacteria bacterium]|jgi:SH3 domain protein|nr:TIGR04211 family SH3 domain-containing protein [Gammaproteobacteria bacterium]